jgi:hypothetical protein
MFAPWDPKTFYDITMLVFGCCFEFDKKKSRWLMVRLIVGFSIHFIELSVTLAVDGDDIYFAKEFILNQTTNIIEQNSFIYGNFTLVIPEDSRVYNQFYILFSRYIYPFYMSCFILNGGFILLSLSVLIFLCIKYKYDYVLNLRGQKSLSHMFVHYVLFYAFKVISMWTSLFLIFTSLISYGAPFWQSWMDTGVMPEYDFIADWKELGYNFWLLFYSMIDFCLTIFTTFISVLKRCCNNKGNKVS